MAAEPLAFVLVTAIVVTLNGLTALAARFAADRLWRGLPAGPSDAVGAVVRSLPRAIPVWVLLLLSQAAATVPALLIAPTDATGRPSAAIVEMLPALILVGLPVLAVVAIASIVIQARLSLLVPVIVLEEGSARAVLPRTWRLTRGYAIVLFATGLAIALFSAVTAWGASLFLVFAANRLIAGIALGLAQLVTAPLGGIWTVIAWGDLVGARHADSPLMARGRGRWVTAAFILGIGAFLLVVGIGVAGAGMATFMLDR
jgi:hypothetical protein